MDTEKTTTRGEREKIRCFSNRTLALHETGALRLGGETNLFLEFAGTRPGTDEHIFVAALPAGTLCPSCEKEIFDDGEAFFALVPVKNFEAERVPEEEISDKARSAWLAVLGDKQRRRESPKPRATDAPEDDADGGSSLRGAMKRILDEHRARRREAELARARERAHAGEALRSRFEKMFRIAGGKVAESVAARKREPADALAAALKKIAQAQKIRWDDEAEAAAARPGENILERLKKFVAESRWRMRRVSLPDDLPRTLSEPLLAFRREDAAPVVLLFSEGGNVLFDAGSNRTEPLDEKAAGTLDETAFRFYRLFPEKPVGIGELLKFIFAEIRPFIFIIAGISAVTGLISLVMPVATEYVTGKIIPTANFTELNQVMALLIVLTVSNTAFGLVPKIAMLVFGTKMLEQTQSAVFDRLLRAPLRIFQNYDSGDLAVRASGVISIQERIFTIVSKQFFASVCSLLSCVMMFYYSVKLALIGMAFVVVYSTLVFFIAKTNLKWQAVLAEATGQLAGTLRQFIAGFATVRVCAAEDRVVAKYFEGFSTTAEAQYRVSRTNAVQDILGTAFPPLMSLLFYACVGGKATDAMSTATFLAFISAFSNFQSGAIGVTTGAWKTLEIIPLIERTRCILDTEVECSAGKAAPARLDGSVELSHVAFRYAPDAPLVLKDVSLRVNPGEFVAVVGPSGAGKSSLVRLLLGFDVPESGAVYYSGQDLASLDVRAVRRRLGVILQNSTVVPGSILNNIVTGTDCRLADAERALELAAMKEEVDRMPMGIHTIVSPVNISGGQQQRILIARALVGNPAVIIMDESTSALDNNAQEAVKRNMETLKSSRIVIAHRLSTIVNADRIYVLEKGRVVQSGTYRELIAQEGVFRRLAERQLAESLS